MESPFWSESHLVGLGSQLRNFRVAGSLGDRAHIKERNVCEWLEKQKEWSHGDKI